MGDMSEFEKELRDLINKYSEENYSNTPDFILAVFMNRCLLALGDAIVNRDSWYSKDKEKGDE